MNGAIPWIAGMFFLLTLFVSLAAAVAPPQEEEKERLLREKMVREQIVARGVKEQSVVQVFRDVPRHLFVPPQFQAQAYDDKPLPIGKRQTISQPYIVALMTELLRPEPGDKVLEVGTGSGYQSAILSRLVREVDSIEIVPDLALEAERRLMDLGFSNVTVRVGDGYAGWSEKAPFDRIIVTAAPPKVPAALIAQLKRGGRMVLPVGESVESQNLLLIEKSSTSDEITERVVAPVLFVPMVKGPGSFSPQKSQGQE